MNRPFSNQKNLVEIEASVVAETEEGKTTVGAVRINAGDKIVWLPKSQLEDWPDVGEYGTVLMPDWLAREKGLI